MSAKRIVQHLRKFYMSNKNTSSNAVNISLYFMAMIIPKAISFALLPLLSRYMTASDFGIVSYCHNVSTIYAGLAAMGLNVYYLRFYQKHHDAIDAFTGSLFFAMLIWNFLLLFILGGGISLLFKGLNVGFPFYPYMALQLMAQFFLNVEIIPSRTLRMQNRVPLYLLASVLSSVSIAIFSIIFVVFLEKGAFGRLIGDFLAAIIVAVFLIFSIRKHLQLTIKEDFLKEGLKFSLPLVPGELFVKLVNVSGTVIIERFVQLSALGIFSIAQYFSMVIEMILNSISMAIEPELMIGADKPNYFEHYLSYKKLYMVFTLSLGVLVGVFSEECLFLLFPPDYIEAWKYIQFLCIACVLLTLNNTFCWFNYAQLKTWVRSASVISSSVLSILTIILFAPIIGIYATAVSLIVARLATSIISYIFISKEKSLKTLQDIFCIFILVLTYLVVYWVNPMQLPIKILIKFFVSVLAICVFVKFYDVNPATLLSFLKKKVARK